MLILHVGQSATQLSKERRQQKRHAVAKDCRIKISAQQRQPGSKSEVEHFFDTSGGVTRNLLHPKKRHTDYSVVGFWLLVASVWMSEESDWELKPILQGTELRGDTVDRPKRVTRREVDYRNSGVGGPG